MLAVIVAATFVGCTNTENTLDDTPTPSAGIYRQLTFTVAQPSDESRTHHNGETILWSDGDRIRISYTKNGVWQNADGRAAGDAATAKLYASTEQNGDSMYSIFRITQYFSDTGEGEHVFYGIHPSQITKGNKPDFSDSENGIVPILLPQIQNPSATSFDSSADLLASRSANTYDSFPTYEEHISMIWTRLVTHGMITLKNLTDAGMTEGEKIHYVEFAADEDVALTGDFALDIAGQTLAPTNARNKVRMSFVDNAEYNTLFDADADGVADDFVVWFATAPFATNDITVTVCTNKATYTRTFVGANKTFAVNKRNLLGVNMSQATRTAFEMVEAYELLTDASLLAVGKKVVIAAADADMALSTTWGTSYPEATPIVKDGTYLTINDNVQVFEVKEGASDKTWAFGFGDKYLCVPTSGGSYNLKNTNTLNNYSSWSVTIDSDTGVATLKCSSSATNPYVRYYKSGNTFRRYSSSVTASYQNVSLYHNVASSEAQLKQMVAPVIESATEMEGNTVNVVWSHDTTNISEEVYYTIVCTKGENKMVFDSITEKEFIADNLADGVWSITVTAHADGYETASTETVEVDVIGMSPSIKIEPSSLSFAGSGGSQNATIAIKNLGSNIRFTFESDNDAFSAKRDGTSATLIVTAKKNETDAERSGKITVTVAGSKATVQTEILVWQEPGVVTYEKINDMLKDFSGQYLIVCEEKSNAFKGSLSTLNAADNNKGVIISVNEIDIPFAENNIYFTIEKSGVNYTIKSASGKYIGKTDNAIGLDENASPKYNNTIMFNGSSMDIVGAGGAHLRFNANSTANRFNYYPSTSYTDYQPIHLYRLKGTGSNETLTRLATPVVTTSVDGSTITVSWEVVANAESYKVTCGDESQTVTGTSVSFSDLQYSTEYTVSVVAVATVGGDYYDSAAATATATTGENPNAGQGMIDVIDLAFTGITSTTYGTWTNTSNTSQVVYKGNSAKDKNGIAIKATTPSGIVATSSAGKATMVIVTWNSATTSGRTLDIYGKNDAYSQPSDLYNSSATTKGTKLGSIVFGTSTALVINGDYEYIGLRSNANTMYIDEIQIVWNYTPLAAPTVTATVEGNTATVSWSEVAGAANYTVTCGEQTQTVTGTSATFTGLPYWSTQTISVVANPAADSTTNCFSPTATASVEIGANPTKREYSFTILPEHFPAAVGTNNVTMTATATDGSGDKVQISWTSTSMKINGGYAYWQSGSLLYNTVDLGSIVSVVINPTNDKLTTTIGSTQKPTSAVEGGGYFQIKASGTVSSTESITVTFEK